jgi:hypothetical protein
LLEPLAISALTDVILASQLMFLAGLSLRPGVQPMSPAWIWGVTLGLTGLASMIGAIDHGFFEPLGHAAHRPLVVLTRVTIIVGSFTMIVAASLQYLRDTIALIPIVLAAVAALPILYIIFTSDDFLSVIVFYSIGFLFLLALSIFVARKTKHTFAMIIGIVASLAISMTIPMGFEGFWGLGLFGTYHILLMPVMFVLFFGGLGFRTTRLSNNEATA